MANIIQTLAEHTGIDPASIEKALGAILGMLKSQLPAETFSQIESRIPESTRLVESPPAAPESSGSLLDVAGKLAGKVFGTKAQDGIEMIEQVKTLGISTDSLASIITNLFKFLSAHLPPEVMAQIVKALPSIPGVNLTSDGLAGEPAPE